MPIALQCPACGRQYQLKRELAGKRATCKCGRAMTVPAADQGEEELDGLPPLPAAPQAAAAGQQPSATSVSGPPDLTAGTADLGGWGGPMMASPTAGPSPQGPPRRKRPTGMRIPIAILSMVYGLGLVLWETLYSVLTLDFFSFDFVTAALGGVVVAGGVLLLRNHRAGPGTTGLACLLATFWPVYALLERGTLLLAARFSLWGLPYLLLAGVLIGVASVIIVWCLREEQRRDRTSNYPPI